MRLRRVRRVKTGTREAENTHGRGHRGPQLPHGAAQAYTARV